MTRIEQSGPQQFSLAGSTLAHFMPSLLENFQRAQQPPNTVTLVTADDPRHSPAFVNDKRPGALGRFHGTRSSGAVYRVGGAHTEQHGAGAIAHWDGPVAVVDSRGS